MVGCRYDKWSCARRPYSKLCDTLACDTTVCALERRSLRPYSGHGQRDDAIMSDNFW